MSAVSNDQSTWLPAMTMQLLRAPLADLLGSLEQLPDDALLANPDAVKEALVVICEQAQRLEEVRLHLANSTVGKMPTPPCPRCESINAPDPQVLRAIKDIRTLRAETAQERKARAAVEADLHREVVETVHLLLGFLERRWPERVGQCREAARLARRLADVAALMPDEAQAVQVAALLQDVGLIALPDALLRNNSGGLPPAQQALYQQHPAIAAEALGSGTFAQIGAWIRHHHERWDGYGYPAGLAGEEIPLPARIVALATAYVEAVVREGGTAVAWRREQISSGAFDPSLLRLLEPLVRRRTV